MQLVVDRKLVIEPADPVDAPQDDGVVQDDSTALRVVMAILAMKNPSRVIEPTMRVYDEGLADSQGLIDIIMEIENQGLEFDFFALNHEEPITALTIAQAIRVP